MTIDDKLIMLMFKMHDYVPTAVYFVETDELALIVDEHTDPRKLATDMGMDYEEE